MKKFAIHIFLATSLALAGMDSYSVGGVAYQSETFTATVGQSYGTVTAFGLIGYWAELDNSGNPVPSKSTSPAKNFAVQFHSHFADVRFQVPTDHVQISLYQANGQHVQTLWQGNVTSNLLNIRIPLENLSSKPLLFVVQGGNFRRSFQFIPNHQ